MAKHIKVKEANEEDGDEEEAMEDCLHEQLQEK